jgi:putative ABC transport system permease protein
VIVPFNTLIEEQMNLPFLLPEVGNIAGYAVITVLVSVVSCAVAVTFSAFRISRIDTSLILRGE